MESINNDLNNNKNYLNYTLKTFNNHDGLVNDYIKSNPASMYSSKPIISKKYPEFQSLQKHDYLSLFDINKVDYTNLITNKRHSGYFVNNLTNNEIENNSKLSNNSSKLNDDSMLKDQDLSSDNSKHSNLDLKEAEITLSNKTADSSIGSDSSLPDSAHKLSFGKSPEPNHSKITDLNDDLSKSPDFSTLSNENDLQPTLTTVTNDNNINMNPINVMITNNNNNLNTTITSNHSNNSTTKRGDQVIETQITAQTIYKKDEAQASPLFLKIMSKLSELPDSMLFSNTNHNTSLNKTHETNNELNTSNNASNTSNNNELNQSTDSKQTVSDMMNTSDQQNNVPDKQHSQSIPLKLNEKVLKSLNKRNIVIVRRPTAPAPTPVIANKLNINRSLNKEKAASTYLESNILQKPSLNLVQRRLKDDSKRVKHRSMYVDSELFANQSGKYESEMSIHRKCSEKYSSNLAMDGLNVFASPATYMSKIREIHVEAIKTPSPDYDKKLKTPSGPVPINLTTPTGSSNKKENENNQIEESLKCFSYLDNLDDSINTEDKLTDQVANKKSIDSKEITSLTIQTPSSINYNIRMNTDKEDKNHHHQQQHHNNHSHHADEPTIKLRAKNNELVASINIMEASLTNKLLNMQSPKTQVNTSQQQQQQDEKLEEIEKTANFDLSSNDSETENSYYARKSSAKSNDISSSTPKKNIIIKKVKTEPPLSPKKYENLREDNTNTAKITNNIILVNNINNNNNTTNGISASNNTQQTTHKSSSKKPTKIVDIHLIEKPKHIDHLKEEKVKVKVPVIHTSAVSTTSQRPVTMIEQIETEKTRHRMFKKNSSEKEKEKEKEKESTKNKIIIKKITPEETSKYHAELSNLKRFNGIVANAFDIKSIAYKPDRDRAALLSERPKTTVPMDTLSSQQHQTYLRKISTPPPLPNILDKLEMLHSPKSHHHHHHNHHYYDHSLDHEIKVINSQHIDAKSSISSGLRPVSITSSIRSGKSEKPIRLNHGIPPPPASLSSNKESQQKYNLVTAQLQQQQQQQHQSSQGTTSSSKKYTNDFNTKKILPITSNLVNKLKINENNNTKKSSHPESEIYVKESKSKPVEEESPKKEKYKIQATVTTSKKTSEKPSTSKKVSIEEEKAKPKTLVLNGMSTNIPIDENFGGRCTNLPQLGAIDYIYKTSDDRYMTSQSPFTYDTNSNNNNNNKKAKSKENDKSSKNPDTPGSNRKNTNTPKHHQYNDDLIDKFDSSLPWSSKDLKNGKNFYENYAKENDRRKKEGNGFLMLLPGIAIPIDTDANDSDEDATSDSLE